MDPRKYVTILAEKNGDVFVVDQITWVTDYQRVYGNSGPLAPLSSHFSGMKDKWPSSWTIISKDLWEQKYGKVVYP